MRELQCQEFENRLVDYIDGTLDRECFRGFSVHALKCRGCRRMLDDVKKRLQAESDPVALNASRHLEISLESIPTGRWECARFEETITEFLDGFVPPPAYRRFAAHSAVCDTCSCLLTDVVYAVAACHSVHTYEELDVPPALTRRLGLIGGTRASRLNAPALLKRMTSLVPVRFASWSALALATWTFLIVGFSEDFTLQGIYRRAHVTAAELYTQGVSIYSKKQEMDVSQMLVNQR